MQNTILLWFILLPALAGLVSFIWPRRAFWMIHLLTLVVTLALLIAAIGLQSHIGTGYHKDWLEIGKVSLDLDLLATRFGSVIVLFTTFFGVLITLYSIGFVSSPSGRQNAYILWTLAGAIGAALANNFLFLLISWEVVSLMLFLLINTGTAAAKNGAAKTFGILGFGDCALLLGILLLLFNLGKSPTISQLGTPILVSMQSPVAVASFLLLALAAFAKAGSMPLHTWIPSAADGAPTHVMAFLPASLDKLLGIYLLARVSLEFFTLNLNFKLVLMIIGAFTIITAVMMAMIQHDLKKLLSFHAISQVGYMVLGLGTGTMIGVAGALFHMINNAIYKNCLFLVAGSVEKQTGSTDLDKLGGLARAMPLTFLACVVSALAISGVPPLNGFTSKWMIYQSLMDVPSRLAPILVTAALFGSALTLASFVKVIHSVFLGAPAPEIARRSAQEVSSWMTSPMLILALLCILFGIFAAFPLSHYVVPSMDSMGEAVQGFSLEGALWSSGTATVLILLALLGGLGIFIFGKGLNFRQGQTYIGGESLPASAHHYSGTGFYTTIGELPGIKGIYNDAQREIFDIYHVAAHFGSSLVNMLRRCQTGVLSLYVSWVILGLVIILMYLIIPSSGYTHRV